MGAENPGAGRARAHGGVLQGAGGSTLHTLIDLSPDPVDQARERFALRDYRGAVLFLEEAIGAGCGYADAHNLLGLSLALLDRPEDALVAFNRAIERNPRYVEAHLNRGILLNGLGRMEEAAASFTMAERLGGRDESGYPAMVGNRLANAHATLGDEYRGAGALDEAIAQYQRALALRPRYIDIQLTLARTFLEAQRYGEAAEVLDRVLAVRSQLLDAMLLRGLAAYFQAELETAQRWWDAAAAAHPHDSRVEIYRSMLAKEKAKKGTADAGQGAADA